MSEKTQLPPIATLFKESWEEFKKSILKLFFLFLIQFGLYIGSGIIFTILFFVFGIGAFFSNPEQGIANALTNPVSLIGFIVTFVIAAITFILIGLTFQVATMKLIYNPEKESLKPLIKSSFHWIAPVFSVSFLAGLLAIGGFGVLVIPGVIIAFLFSFSTYEVLFNKQTGANALRRSYALFSTNFWGILGRLLLLAVISFILTIAISQNNKAGILVAIVNTIIGWFSICYSIALYKQVAKGNEHLPGKSLKGIVIISIIGFVIISLITVGIINVAKNMPKKELPDTPNMHQMQDYTYPGEMPTEQEMNDMLKNLPQGDSMQFEDKSI